MEEAMRLMPHIVVTGSPADGFTFHGPFVSGVEAVRWAEDMFPDESWWTDKIWPAAPTNREEEE